MKSVQKESAQKVCYRFFVSYCREDKELAQELRKKLEEKDCEVRWDLDITGGTTDSWKVIQKDIERAHFFAPVMTLNTLMSTGVQQEIGYALACNIPVIPVTFGELPDDFPAKFAMISSIQWSPVSNLPNVEKLFSLLQEKQGKAVFQRNLNDTEKPTLIINNAQEIIDRFISAKIVQRSSMTSFSIPEVDSSEDWIGIDKTRLFWLNSDERSNLESLGNKSGYDLIIDPCFSQDGDYLDILQAKLRTLKKFLEDKMLLEDKKKKPVLRVVVNPFKSNESEIIIGDHWMAHSAAVATMETERETISTWHAPTIGRSFIKFQKEFQSLYDQQQKATNGRNSAQYAIDMIDCRLNKLTACKTVPHGRCEKCDVLKRSQGSGRS